MEERIVHIPAMSIRVTGSPDDISAIYEAMAIAHGLVSSRAKVEHVSCAPIAVVEPAARLLRAVA
jgi:hypothetical protein